MSFEVYVANFNICISVELRQRIVVFTVSLTESGNSFVKLLTVFSSVFQKCYKWGTRSVVGVNILMRNIYSVIGPPSVPLKASCEQCFVSDNIEINKNTKSNREESL
jgi:hypothetical protein